MPLSDQTLLAHDVTQWPLAAATQKTKLATWVATGASAKQHSWQGVTTQNCVGQFSPTQPPLLLPYAGFNSSVLYPKRTTVSTAQRSTSAPVAHTLRCAYIHPSAAQHATKLQTQRSVPVNRPSIQKRAQACPATGPDPNTNTVPEGPHRWSGFSLTTFKVMGTIQCDAKTATTSVLSLLDTGRRAGTPFEQRHSLALQTP